MGGNEIVTMGKAAAECLKNPGRPSYWLESEGRYICPEENDTRRTTAAFPDRAVAPQPKELDPRFKLVFLTAATGTLLFTLICVTIHLVTNGELPPARKELSDGIFTMAKIGFGAIVGLLGGKVL
jgi:hypothetical protein